MYRNDSYFKSNYWNPDQIMQILILRCTVFLALNIVANVWTIFVLSPTLSDIWCIWDMASLIYKWPSIPLQTFFVVWYHQQSSTESEHPYFPPHTQYIHSTHYMNKTMKENLWNAFIHWAQQCWCYVTLPYHHISVIV